MMVGLNVDDLAQELRRIKGLQVYYAGGAYGLAEALMPFLARYQTAPSVSFAGAGDARVAEGAGGWRPRSEAPRDGTKILAVTWAANDFDAPLFPEYHIASYDALEGDGWCDQSGFPTDMSFTHWMPIPAHLAQGKPDASAVHKRAVETLRLVSVSAVRSPDVLGESYVSNFVMAEVEAFLADCPSGPQENPK